ncbi:MAG TPA: TIM barrel protein [Candidatus Brocadiia bacterium]|nr:TIM barrel protein [Candidatus Brocadiia bacterium]
MAAFCFNTITAGPDADLIALIGLLPKYGFRLIEFHALSLESHLQRRGLTPLAFALKRNRVRAAGVSGFPFLPFSFDERRRAEFAETAEMCASLGGRTLSCPIAEGPPPGGTLDDCMRISMETARDYGRMAAEFGLRVALESRKGHLFMSHPVETLEVIRRTGRENVGLDADTIQLVLAQCWPDAVRSFPREKLFGVHLAAALFDRDYLCALESLRYDGPVTLRTPNPGGWEEPIEETLAELRDKIAFILTV